MPELESAFAGRYAVGRYPAAGDIGVSLCEIVGWDLVQLAAWRGRGETLWARVADSLGVTPPASPNQCVRADGIELLTTAPLRLWCLAPAGDERLSALAGAIDADTGCLTQLGHSHARVRLQGPGVRRLLAQEIALDLAPEAFPTDTIGRTLMHHVPVLLQCIDAEADSFDLYLPRTYAASHWEYLLDLALAHGYAIDERRAHAADFD